MSNRTCKLQTLAAGVVAAAMLIGCAAHGQDVQPVFAPPPRLAITAAELEQAKAEANFEQVRDAAVKRADALLADPPILPQGYGSWPFYYACADDANRLKPLSLTEHQCPKCGKVYTDERTVAAYRGQLHDRLNAAALDLAWAYAYTGDDKYVAGVQRILLKLADDYDTYPDRLDRWGRTGMLAVLGGRRYVQSLEEAVGVIKLAKAYDLTRTSAAWSDEQRHHVEEDFFRLTARTLLRFGQGRSNHQTWFNAGLIAIASVLADRELVHMTLHMSGGVYDQLARSVGDDGLWWEGTMAYHNYALQPMLEIADATRRLGLDVHEHPRLKLMILGPLRAAYPDGSFPAINDSDPIHLRGFNHAFAWAAATYGDPMFSEALAGRYPTLPSEALRDAGLAVLRVGAGGDAACVFLDFGEHGGGHGHYDKLNITLFASGREWLLDPGRLNYSHKEYHTWVKMTAAHNTVTLGGRNQAACAGKLLWLEHHDNYAACAAETTDAYPGATLRRYLLLTPKVLVDVFDVETGKATQIDWLIHASAGSADGAPADASLSLGEHDGYPHLTDVGRSESPPASWSVTHQDKRLRVWLVPADGEAVYTARGIGYHVTQRTPTLVRRRHGNRTRFVSVTDLSGTGEYVTGVRVEDDAVVFETADGAWAVRFAETAATLTQR